MGVGLGVGFPTVLAEDVWMKMRSDKAKVLMRSFDIFCFVSYEALGLIVNVDSIKVTLIWF